MPTHFSGNAHLRRDRRHRPQFTPHDGAVTATPPARTEPLPPRGDSASAWQRGGGVCRRARKAAARADEDSRVIPYSMLHSLFFLHQSHVIIITNKQENETRLNATPTKSAEQYELRQFSNQYSVLHTKSVVRHVENTVNATQVRTKPIDSTVIRPLSWNSI